MFRATIDTQSDGSVVSIAGQLTKDFVEEAESLCLSAVSPLVIDCAGLMSCDEDGLALLLRLHDRAASIEGLSEYLQMRVDSETSRESNHQSM